MTSHTDPLAFLGADHDHPHRRLVPLAQSVLLRIQCGIARVLDIVIRHSVPSAMHVGTFLAFGVEKEIIKAAAQQAILEPMKTFLDRYEGFLKKNATGYYNVRWQQGCSPTHSS